MKSKAAFQLYPNILESICTLGDKNLAILIRELNHLIAQIDVEDCAEVERFCDDFAQNLNQKGCVFAQFCYLKPHVIQYWKNVINGNKGREFGKLGGAPKGNKNAAKKQPPYNFNDNINNNDKNNISDLFNGE